MLSGHPDFFPMLRAYFDLSRSGVPSKRILLTGEPEDRETQALVGYVASVEAWHRFDSEWRAALQRWGVRFLHTTDCRRGEGAFAGWGRQKALAFLSELLEITRRHVLLAVGAVVPVADRDDRRTPYLICVQRCLQTLLSNPAVPPDEDIEVYFEFEDKVRGETIRYVERLKASKTDWGWERLKKIGFVTKDVPAVQGADLIAFEHMRLVHEHSRWGLTREQFEALPIESYVCERFLFDVLARQLPQGIIPFW
jgi:hypothetical protein